MLLHDVLLHARQRGVLVTVHRHDVVEAVPGVAVAAARIVADVIALGSRDVVLSLAHEPGELRVDLRLGGLLRLSDVRHRLRSTGEHARHYGGTLDARRTARGAIHVGARLPL